MALIKCSECGKDVSDKAPACPNCGNPNQPNKVLLQLDTAPQKRRKWRIGILIFFSMFIVGGLMTISGLSSGTEWVFSTGSLFMFFGFIGSIVAKIGSWLAKP